MKRRPIKILSCLHHPSFWWNYRQSCLIWRLITCPYPPSTPPSPETNFPSLLFFPSLHYFVLYKCVISSLISWERKLKFGAKWQREQRLSWREHWYRKDWRPLCAHFGKVEQWLSPELAVMDLQQPGLKHFMGLDVDWCMCVEGVGVCVLIMTCRLANGHWHWLPGSGTALLSM